MIPGCCIGCYLNIAPDSYLLETELLIGAYGDFEVFLFMNSLNKSACYFSFGLICVFSFVILFDIKVSVSTVNNGVYSFLTVLLCKS